MSDAWSDIQALKTKQSSLREKLAQRKKQCQEVVDEIYGTSSSTSVKPEPTSNDSLNATLTPSSSAANLQTHVKDEMKPVEQLIKLPPEVIAEVEKILLSQLTDISLNLPVELKILWQTTAKALNYDLPFSVVDDLIQKYSAQALLSTKTEHDTETGTEKLYIDAIDHTKLTALVELEGSKDVNSSQRKRKQDNDPTALSDVSDFKFPATKQIKKSEASKSDQTIESLLSSQSAMQRESKKVSEEILSLLSKPTAKEQSIVEKFRSQGGAQVQEFCGFGTREECSRSNPTGPTCDKLHFKKIIHKHTDESLGDCSFLNTCFHMDTCKYVHYQIDYPANQQQTTNKSKADVTISKRSVTEGSTILYPPQWVQCDLRHMNMSTLGKFAVIMADPPWDIHMELPYGTMSDDEMRRLSIPVLQDDGYIFLWVTGRAMELGRECLALWGYERVDELIWVKTNQLQRIIRTGRTGHWLNHGKEHCLVGVKGNLKNVNRGLDCDVIVAEVRATSHKPDEIYGIIERLSPGTRKIELFGRPHNVQPNWVTLGNQVDGVKLVDPDMVRAFKKVYPDGNCMKPPAVTTANS
jgi:mRNA (2'-O-methyladenosine-N6-)-methyltransferase